MAARTELLKYSINGNPTPAHFSELLMSRDMLLPKNIDAPLPAAESAHAALPPGTTARNVMNMVAANYEAQPQWAPGGNFFRNDVPVAAAADLSGNLEPAREIFTTTHTGERVLLKYIPEDTMMFTYFKYPKKPHIVGLFRDAEAAGRPFTAAELFRVRLDFLRARLNYEFTVTEIRNDFGDGHGRIFCTPNPFSTS